MQKNVLITTALSKIGISLSQAFRQEGYYVYGLDLEEDFHNYCDRFLRFDLKQFVKDAGYRIKFTAIFDEVIPKLHVLINNSTFSPFDKLENIKLEDWQQALDVNLTGPMLLSKLFLDRLKDGIGCIINIGSLQQDMLQAGFVTRNCSNTALIGLTEAMSVDLKGIVRANAISLQESTSNSASQDIAPNEGYAKENAEEEPGEGQSQFEGLAKMALFLASEDAEFLTGRNFFIDG